MDSPEILFYIIAALIYFFTKKKKKPRVPPPADRSESPSSQPEPPSEPTLTFEELLKELTGQSSKSTPEPKPEPVEVKPEVSAKSKWEHEGELKPLTSSFDDTEINKKFQDAIYEEEEEVEMPIGGGAKRFDPYTIKEKHTMASDIKELLSNPDDLKKAVILQEVLGRRY